MKQKFLQKKSGSSLLMVLLIISGVLVVVFSSQRISLVQFSQSSKEEENLFAYYAAKAGIEDGLARFRFNRNVETQQNENNGSNYISRLGLTNASYPTVAGSTEVEEKARLKTGDGFVYDPSGQSYDLKINYRAGSIGVKNDGSLNFDGKNVAAKESATTLTGFKSLGVADSYFLRHGFKFINCSDSKAFVQIEQINQVDGQILSQIQVVKGALEVYDSAGPNANLQILANSAGTNSTTSIRFRPYYCDVEYAFISSKTNNGEGLGTNAGPAIDSLKTTLTATGYYGSAKRTLVGEIDRKSGNLIGVYDFNIYAQNNVTGR